MRSFRQNWFRRNSLIGEYSEHLGTAIIRHRGYLALQAANVQAQLLSKSKSEFIANMSHELRTPLNAVLGFSAMLGKLGAQETDKVGQYAYYIQESAQHLLSLINRILDLSKIQAGQLSINPQPFALHEIAGSCVAIVENDARQKGIAFTEAVAPGLPLLVADPLRVKQILINLLSNAVKFTPSGGRVALAARLVEHGQMEISVRDSGIGMTEAEIEVALQPFRQVHTGLDKQYDGTGLGLPISNALAQLQGGEIRIASEKGAGTVVAVLLPTELAPTTGADFDRRPRMPPQPSQTETNLSATR